MAACATTRPVIHRHLLQRSCFRSHPRAPRFSHAVRNASHPPLCNIAYRTAKKISNGHRRSTELHACALSHSAASPRPESQWVVIIALSAGALFLCSMHRSFFSVLLPQIAAQFDLSSTQVGILQAMTLFGYVAGQMPAGILADRFGGAPVLLTGLMLWSLANCLTSLAVVLPPLFAVGMSRVLMGLSSSVVMPCSSAVTASWVPSGHKASALASIMGSFNIGNAAGLFAAPVVAAILGWEIAFTWAGAVGCIWAIFGWGILIHSDSVDDVRVPRRSARKKAGQAVPWWKGPSAKQVFVLCATHGVMGWGSFVLSGWMPMYLHSQGVTDPSVLGGLACIPYISASIVGMVVGQIADRMVRAGWRKLDVRRLMQSVMQLGLAAFCLPLALNTNLSLHTAMVCLTGAVSCYSFSYAGFHAYIQDVAAADAGKLLGITNTCSISMGILSTLSTGLLVDTFGSFQIVFLIMVALYTMSCYVWNTNLSSSTIRL